MFEQNLQKAMFSGMPEKTFVDKILSRQDVDAIREIVRKPRLTRSELLDVMYLISGTESKLVNYGQWDRYVVLKFFVWIREFIKVAEILYDYQDNLKLKEKKCDCGGHRISEAEKKDVPTARKLCKCKTPKFAYVMSDRTKRLLENNERLLEHNAKFLIDLYLNIARTSLSLGASGFRELLTNKFELAYPNAQPSMGVQQEKPGLFKR